MWLQICHSSSLYDAWSVAYRTDDSASFSFLGKQSKLDQQVKRKEAAAMAKLTKANIPALETSVLATAQLEHFATVSQHGVFFSLPAHSEADLVTLDTFFQTSHLDNARARRAQALGSDDLMILDDVDAEQCKQRTFFRLAVAGLGYKKTMRVSAVSGRKLSRTDLTVAVSNQFVGALHVLDEEHPLLIDSTKHTEQEAGDSLCVLSCLGDPILATEQLLEWDSSSNVSLNAYANDT